MTPETPPPAAGPSGPAGAAAPPADQTAAAVAAPALPSWLAALDERTRDLIVKDGFHKTRGPDGGAVEATKEQALGSLIKAYQHAVRRLGAPPERLIDAPADPGDPTWWKANGSKLGVPETPEGYEIKRPELPEGMAYDEEFEREALAEFHAAGVPKHAAQMAVDIFTKYAGGFAERADSDRALAKVAMRQELAAEWGRETDVRMDQARRAFNQIADEAGIPFEDRPGLVARLAQDLGGGAKGDAGVIRMMHRIHQWTAEARAPGLDGDARTPAFRMTRADAAERMAKIQAPDGDWARAMREGDRKAKEALMDELARLSKVIAGSPEGGR